MVYGPSSTNLPYTDTLITPNSIDSVYSLVTYKKIVNPSLSCLTSSTATSNEIVVYGLANVTPSVNIATSGTSVCTGGSVTLTATPTNGGSAPVYQWTKGGVAISGATATTYKYTPSIGDSSIYCSLTANNTCQTSSKAISNGIKVTVNTPITPSITSVGNNPICLTTGDSLVLTTTSITAQWYRNNVSIPKATSNRYAAHLYGSYSVYAPDINGCYATSTPIVVHEQFVPAPIISRVANVLTSSYSGTNQWYQNTVSPVATTSAYTFDTTVYAVYSVQAVVNGCKSPMSNYIVNTRDSINSVNENCPTVTTPILFSSSTQKVDPNVVTLTYEGSDLSIKIFPNPSSSNAYLQITGVTSLSAISVTDMLGRVVWRNTVGANKTISLPAGTLAKGIYVVSVSNEGQHQEVKWFINR